MARTLIHHAGRKLAWLSKNVPRALGPQLVPSFGSLACRRFNLVANGDDDEDARFCLEIFGEDHPAANANFRDWGPHLAKCQWLVSSVAADPVVDDAEAAVEGANDGPVAMRDEIN